MKLSLSKSLIPSRISHVILYWSEGYLYIHRKHEKSISKLNFTAAFIWQLCNGENSLGEIENIVDKANSEDIQIEDVSETIKSFINNGLVNLSKTPVQPAVRLSFSGFPRSFDVHDNFFLNQLTNWIDVNVVEENENADITIFSNNTAHQNSFTPNNSVNILLDEKGTTNDFSFDLVFTTNDQYNSTDSPYVVVPQDYLENPTSSIDQVGRQILHDLFADDVRVPDIIPSISKDSKKKLTIGMATYDDYDGVYFSVQAIRMFHPEVMDEIEILVIDNNPDGPCSKDLKALGSSIQGYRYIPNDEIKGTGVRGFVFQEAQTDYVLCIDSHVFIEPGAIRKLIDYFDAHPETPDLLQGPLVYDDLSSISTHFEPVWREGMMGIWSTDERGRDPDGEPFDIPIQGMGLAACRKSAWPGYNKRFKGFCVEEGYIHQKFRNAGGRTLCLPFLRWLHRFARPLGVPYENVWEDRIRNYLIAFDEVGLDQSEVIEHFSDFVNPDIVQNVIKQLDDEERELRATSHIQINEELPFVSCFCPTYGRPHLLEEAIECFLRQDYKGHKELVILNDFNKQEFVYDHPEVRIINSPERILPLGRKFNECVRLCQGDILFVWDDDDIYLPWRISYSVKHMKNGLFHTNQAYFEEQRGAVLTTSRNMFHCNLAVSTDRFWSVGGYPEDRDRSNVDVDIFNRLEVRSDDIPQTDVFYVYRWSGTDSFHVSQFDGVDKVSSECVKKYIDSQIQSGDCPSGRIELQPQLRNDWLKLVKNASAVSNN